MKANQELQSDIIIFRPTGKIIGIAAVHFRQTIEEQLTRVSGVPKLLIDFADVPLMGCSGCGALVAVHRSIASRGGRIAFINASRASVNLMAQSRLFNLFEHFPSEAQAIAALTEARSGPLSEISFSQADLKRPKQNFEEGVNDAHCGTIDQTTHRMYHAYRNGVNVTQ